MEILTALYQDYEDTIKINRIEMKEIDKNLLRKKFLSYFKTLRAYFFR